MRSRHRTDENSELFWALHGGGGNFGVATKLVFGLHELPAATLALLLWPADAGPEITRTYRDLVDAGRPRSWAAASRTSRGRRRSSFPTTSRASCAPG